MLKSVTQEHAAGCGIATVSFITKQPYKKILGLLPKGKEYAKNRGFYCRELVGVLKKLGLNYEYFYINKRKRRQIYKTGTIVFIQKSRKDPLGHYLARTDGLWMDSWINYPNLINVKSGFRKRLPGKPIYAIVPKVIY